MKITIAYFNISNKLMKIKVGQPASLWARIYVRWTKRFSPHF